MPKNLEAEIEEEVRIIDEKLSAGTPIVFVLGNFHELLPGKGTTYQQLRELNPGYCRTKLSELLDEDDPRRNIFSTLRLNQTLDEFQETIDAAIKKLGILNEDILEYKRESRATKGKVSYELTKRVVIPLYAELRRMGYNDYPDLTA